ncbi:MAG TPA: hypothetical protein VLA74_13680 [Nitrososphaeraceae archaeon]|nr:hypothetical protein [Nitrososphaeraceae archaeon]
MNKDLAVLTLEDDDDGYVKPLKNNLQMLPKLDVFVWDFSSINIEQFPHGSPVENGKLSEESILFHWNEEKINNRNNEWNKKPEIKVNVFKFNGIYDLGFSGAPVCFNGDKKVIGIFTAKDSNYGYVIPIQIVLEKLEVEILKDKQILYHSEGFMDSVKEKMDICFDQGVPNIIINEPTYSDGYIDIHKRIQDKGGKIRVITEITKDNIEYCKKMKEIGIDELRHLESITCGLAVRNNT